MNTAAPLELEDAPRDASPHDTSQWAWSREALGYMLWSRAEFVTGLNRRVATMITRWLWVTEAIVRRLLLAAAFALDVKPPAPRPKPGAPKQARPEEPAPGDPTAQASTRPRGAFRIFRIHSGAPQTAPQSASHTASASAASPAPRMAIGVLGLDPLLRIGAMPKRRTTPRRYNPPQPLPYDPLYVRNETDEEYRLWVLYGPWKEGRPGYRQPAPRRESSKGRAQDSPYYRPRMIPPDPIDDPTLRPAPNLALRVDALARILRNPEAAALRLAQRLAGQDTARFTNLATPVYKRRKTDKAPDPPDLHHIENAHWTFTQAHAQRRKPDTS